MKTIISKGKERNWSQVDCWVTKSGLLAIVNEAEWSEEVKKLVSSLHDFYTGYVQVPDGFEPVENKIEVHGGVTFPLGKIEGQTGKWIGFDMAHLGDEHNQDLNYAKSQCENMATQIKEQFEKVKTK